MKTKRSKTPKRGAGLYALKDTHGAIIWQAIAFYTNVIDRSPEDAVWGSGGYEWVATMEGEKWRTRTWKQWDKSIASAKKLGWAFVPVAVVEINPL